MTPDSELVRSHSLNVASYLQILEVHRHGRKSKHIVGRVDLNFKSLRGSPFPRFSSSQD